MSATSPTAKVDSSKEPIPDSRPGYSLHYGVCQSSRPIRIHSVKLPPPSSNLNAYAERFVRSIKEDCLERMIFFWEDSLRTAVREYLAHYHAERNHQGLGNRLIGENCEPENRNCSSQPSVRWHSQFLLSRRRIVAHPPRLLILGEAVRHPRACLSFSISVI